MRVHTYDVAVIGGGIVGLATARALLERDPELSLTVIEKESALGSHQTGRNSGVIHSGIYYKPGSLKAVLCREGVDRLVQLCREENVPFDMCGKVIVATHRDQISALEELYRRGQENGVPGIRRIDVDELKAIEPHVAGVDALVSPETGIVDYKEVAKAIGRQIEARGGEIKLNAQVKGIRKTTDTVHTTIIETAQGDVKTRFLINCGGLHSDRIARLTGVDVDVKIVPFRGEYYLLRPESRHLVQGLIYPVPDARLPFLGVHFTRMIDGGVEAGPNAVLAFAREGYTKGTVSIGDMVETFTYRGFLKLVRKYWRTGMSEMRRSLSKKLFVESLRELIPEMTMDDVVSGPAGVRAQAVSIDGALVDDFRIIEAPGAVHVLNAPSPAATASLAIGHRIASLVPGASHESFDMSSSGRS